MPWGEDGDEGTTRLLKELVLTMPSWRSLVHFFLFPYPCVKGRVSDDSSEGSGNVCGHGSTT